MKNFNEEAMIDLTKVIRGRAVKSVSIENERDMFFIMTFFDDSILRIRYDYIYDWEVVE